MSRLTKQELKEDVFVESVASLWDRVQANLGVILGVVGGIVVLTVALTLWGRASEKKESEARATLSEASTQYWSGNYPRTIQLADQVIGDAGGTKAAVDAMRMKADALFWSGAFDSAATLYQDVLKRETGDTPMRLAVQQSLAFALESKKDFAGAAPMFEQIAAKAPDRTNAADFWMAAGRAWRNAGQRDKAKATFEKVASEYKETTFARDAEVALGELEGEAK